MDAVHHLIGSKHDLIRVFAADANLHTMYKSVLRAQPKLLAQLRFSELSGYDSHALAVIANFYSGAPVSKNEPHDRLVLLAAGAEMLRFKRLEPRNYPWNIILND